MIVGRLALKSLLNRWPTASLTIFGIAVSVMLLMGVEKVRNGARQSFADTISGTDLIVGARTGDVQLLLYSVFRIGDATNNIAWKSYGEIAALPEIAWIVPISLGDSHRGFRVMGTTTGYFEHYRYRQGQGLAFAAGVPFADLFDAVLGADVAAALGYRLGDAIIVGHGIGSTSFAPHDEKPFRVAGILAKTGTPVDHTVHVGLEGIEAIHVDWQTGARIPGRTVDAEQVRRMELAPKSVTAAMIGLRSRLDAFQLQRLINEYKEESLSAILPGVALQQLWSLVGTAETALAAVSFMVVLTALLGMVTTILATLNERRREMAILRSVGARPATILGLLTAEAAMLTGSGVALGAALLYTVLSIMRPVVDSRYGLYLPIEAPSAADLAALAAVLGGGVLAGLFPAIRAFRLSLADGMIVKT
ncbi:MAG: ABC transporter permease [Rhodospirillaceae bacterium]|nr:ABC transporter permease [Rhodospirillaceae bacterium]